MEKCYLCNSTEQDEIKYGEFMTRDGISVHYFCLLLTSNLLQRGKDDDGFLGFLLVDIKKEAVRVAPATCYYCKKKGANIACCANKCRRSFHLICGINNNCQNQFVGTFMSFCDRHVTRKKERGPQKNEICCICYEGLQDGIGRYNSVTMLQAPCCKNGWFHKGCLASFAKSAGYFFRCPLCNDSKKFRQRLVYRGIFIPDRDASWELEPNAFSELLERPKMCSAAACNAKGGRTSNNSRNKLIVCMACGSVAMHRCCIENKTENFYCNDCQKTFTEVNDTNVVYMSASNHADSDEEEDVDICGEDDASPILNNMEPDDISQEEIIQPLGRVKSSRLSILDDDESSIECEIIDEKDGIIPCSRFSRQCNGQTFEEIASESTDELETIQAHTRCRRRRRIESSDSGNSIDNILTNPKRITSQDSESFFDSGAGSDRSDSSAEKPNLLENSNIEMKEITNNQTENTKRRIRRHTSLNNEPIGMKEPTNSQTETKPRVRRYTSLNNEPKGDWCVAKRTRRQSVYTEMNISLENTDKSNKCSSRPLTRSSSVTTLPPIIDPRASVKPEDNLVKTNNKLKLDFVPKTIASKTIDDLAIENTSRITKTRSRTQSEERQNLSRVISGTQRRSSLQNTFKTSQDQMFKVLPNKRSRSVSQARNELSQNKKQKNDNTLNENENDYINSVSISANRAPRSRSPLGLYQSSLNAFITPLHLKEKQAQKNTRKQEDCLKNGRLERIKKMFSKNQANISTRKPKRQKMEACIQRNDSNISSTLNYNQNMEITETFSNSYNVFLSSSKKKRGRKNLAQILSEKNLPSNQTRIESFFKRI